MTWKSLAQLEETGIWYQLHNKDGESTGDMLSYRHWEVWETKSELSFLHIKHWSVPTTLTGSVPIGEGCKDKELVASLRQSPQGMGNRSLTTYLGKSFGKGGQHVKCWEKSDTEDPLEA